MTGLLFIAYIYIIYIYNLNLKCLAGKQLIGQFYLMIKII